MNCSRVITCGFGFLSLASGSGSLGSGSDTRNASFAPSGDHAIDETPVLTSVIASASPPRRSRRYTCVFLPSRDERNARYRPSGLQRGDVSGFLLLVSLIGAPPEVDTM